MSKAWETTEQRLNIYAADEISGKFVLRSDFEGHTLIHGNKPATGAFWATGRASSLIEEVEISYITPLSFGKVFRTRAQEIFEEAYSHFFKKDYPKWKSFFDENVTMTSHGEKVTALSLVSCVCVTCVICGSVLCV